MGENNISNGRTVWDLLIIWSFAAPWAMGLALANAGGSLLATIAAFCLPPYAWMLAAGWIMGLPHG